MLTRFDPKEAMHPQIVTYSGMKQMFFKKFDQIVFAEPKIQSFYSLLHEYKQITRKYVFYVGKLKSSYVKEAWIKKYGDDMKDQISWETREKQKWIWIRYKRWRQIRRSSIQFL